MDAIIGGMKVLIVDDHPIFREGLAALLAQIEPDTRVLQASDAAQALALVTQHSDFDMVILDLVLPGMGGLELQTELTRRNNTARDALAESVAATDAASAASIDPSVTVVERSAETEATSAVSAAAKAALVERAPEILVASEDSVVASVAKIVGCVESDSRPSAAFASLGTD